MSIPHLTVLTGNTKKFVEIQESLGRHGIIAQRQDAYIDEIQDLDVSVVVRDKALKAYEAVDGPVLVDDSGIYFERYNSFPGVYSKNIFQGVGYNGLRRLIDDGDRAYFQCFISYMDDQLDVPVVFDATYVGQLRFPVECDYDAQPEMPYASLFFPDDGAGKSMEAMTPQERSADHRHSALNTFAEWFVAQRLNS